MTLTFDDFGIYPVEASMEAQGKVIERLKSATVHEATAYAIELGVLPPTDEEDFDGWVIGELYVQGRNRGGDVDKVFHGLVWNAPDYVFSRQMDRDFEDEAAHNHWPGRALGPRSRPGNQR